MNSTWVLWGVKSYLTSEGDDDLGPPDDNEDQNDGNYENTDNGGEASKNHQITDKDDVSNARIDSLV